MGFGSLSAAVHTVLGALLGGWAGGPVGLVIGTVVGLLVGAPFGWAVASSLSAGSLDLAATNAAFANQRIVALWKTRNEVMRIGKPRGFHDLFLGGAGARISDVLRHRP